MRLADELASTGGGSASSSGGSSSPKVAVERLFSSLSTTWSCSVPAL
eukprot:CAMPEP_0194541244 /NCGR_PEP_ID=MMETSP0253-20130528/81894_1 /TAXON_ID=2966 /ORGANISM="Noctiluca scintillans" /LENGTH=46 /DNA_ID= /DNA_START= /DNA_END= /DNA_ORIENTATION=